ncbi:nicotinate-nucleotide pyrophosphorylase (carboxylating) [Monoraphidium neglectum]|uniref:Nicotinate-nucleotide pyrophosphorylase [carboxylating] n=1 Tax=Monoraphidium neglectum TaxID=145388 RepID=A0A0D2MEX0_9CHLO|nr:nicotinate-nucleotide pyrophosphorylase (carboxylating) [Monoraphidium neglectum]KIZ01665.1 nicotinate-nucleotide pyrophosphorylase (carboxylating) [Monoraphidium neglectum]|eukprot:XP_013900684.1 nicotinate-nucleotide pyrophosphorylase (carboxylating) [Monoraphidium neglectum]
MAVAVPPKVSIAAPQHPTYNVKQVIKAALDEDAGDRGDVTTQATISEATQATATFLAKADGTLAGVAVADMVFGLVDPSLKAEWSKQDGDRVRRGEEFGILKGSARSILVAERIALNFMQRMSGIATATSAMVSAVEGTGTRILETRKTAPGLRLLDKWAVLLGGGANHRMGLYDMMMIKDNHIAAAGGIRRAVERAEAFISEQGLPDLQVELETRTLEEVDLALEILGSGAAPHVSRIMLDNMARRDTSKPGGVDVSMLRAAMARVSAHNAAAAAAGRRAVETEASGNVTLESVRAFAEAGVDFVSVGALTHSVTALDISLNIETQQ